MTSADQFHEEPFEIEAEEVVWANSFGRVALIPARDGAHVAISRPDGTAFHGAATVISDGSHILLVRQQRFAVRRHTWEIPQGAIDDGENAAEAAARELFEETGVTIEPGSLTPLGRVRGDGGILDGDAQGFFGVVEPGTPLTPDPAEVTAAVWADRAAVINACATGVIQDSSTVAAVLRAHLRDLI